MEVLPEFLTALKLIPVAFDAAGILKNLFGLANLLSWVELMITDTLIGIFPFYIDAEKQAFLVCF